MPKRNPDVDMTSCLAVPCPSDLFNEDPAATEPWYCVRTHIKHEHIAAAQLREQGDVEVFLPRIRYRRATRLGPAWVTEALFKDYIFARFDLNLSLRRVQHSRAVCEVVHFGDHWPTVPNSVIVELRFAMGGEDLCLVDETLQTGDSVQINAGSMSGLQAVVTRIMPAKQRVAVLFDFLGRKTTLELDRCQLSLEPDQQTQRRRTPISKESVPPVLTFG
jgi:transcriptional antiterminator RfaH